jgi:hypothetical protein
MAQKILNLMLNLYMHPYAFQASGSLSKSLEAMTCPFFWAKARVLIVPTSPAASSLCRSLRPPSVARSCVSVRCDGACTGVVAWVVPHQQQPRLQLCIEGKRSEGYSAARGGKGRSGPAGGGTRRSVERTCEKWLHSGCTAPLAHSCSSPSLCFILVLRAPPSRCRIRLTPVPWCCHLPPSRWKKNTQLRRPLVM